MLIIHVIIAVAVMLIGMLLIGVGFITGWPELEQLAVWLSHQVSRRLGHNIFTGEKL